jgi:hypothetical protein
MTRLVRRAIGAGWPVVPTYGLSRLARADRVADRRAVVHPTTAAGAAGVALRIGDQDADGPSEIEVASPALFQRYRGDGRDRRARP